VILTTNLQCMVRSSCTREHLRSYSSHCNLQSSSKYWSRLETSSRCAPSLTRSYAYATYCKHWRLTYHTFTNHSFFNSVPRDLSVASINGVCARLCVCVRPRLSLSTTF